MIDILEESSSRQLLLYLLERQIFVSTEEISRVFGWNKKKAQQVLRNLDCNSGGHVKLEFQKNKGWRAAGISPDLEHEILKYSFFYSVHETISPRRRMLAVDLLFRTDYVSMEKLANQYFLSKTVIFEEIKALKRWFERTDGFDLEVSSKNGIFLHGQEIMRRYGAASLIRVDALQSVGVPETLVKQYKKIYLQAMEFFCQKMMEDSIHVSGEDFMHLVRYIAAAWLREQMGFHIEQQVALPMETELFEQLKVQTGVDLGLADQNMVLSLLRDASLLCLPQGITSDLQVIESVEQWLQNKLQTAEPLFENPALIAQNLRSMTRRSMEGRHFPSDYDKEIFCQYPLYVHMAEQVLKTLVCPVVSRTDILDFAVYLGGIFRRKKMGSGTRVLLVGNQKYALLDQIRGVFLGFYPHKTACFDIIPYYVLRSDPSLLNGYDLYLTTEPEVVLRHPQFQIVEVIMTRTHTTAFEEMVRDWQQEYDAAKYAAFCASVQKETIHTQEQLNRLLAYMNKESVSVHTFGHTLCLMEVEKGIPDSAVLGRLEIPLSVRQRKIDQVFVFCCPQEKPDLISYFEQAADLLSESM